MRYEAAHRHAVYLETGHELRVDFWRGGHNEMVGNNPSYPCAPCGFGQAR